MAPGQFTLSPCVPEDVPGMVAVYKAAFANDPFVQYTFPPSTVTPDELHQWLTKRFVSQFAKSEVRQFKMVENSTSTIAAFLRCVFPHVLSEEEKSERAREKAFRESERKEGRDPMWPVGANLDCCDAKFGPLFATLEEIVDDAEWYVMHLLATDPAYQRKGLAGRLLTHVLDMADKEGRMAYIEATNMGYPVYKKLGFEEFDVVEVDVSRWGGREGEKCVNRMMVRKPRTAK